MSWLDGYACYSTNDIDKIASSSDPSHPMLIVLAHDGDNDFGGGYSYYEQCVSGFVDEAQSKVPLTSGPAPHSLIGPAPHSLHSHWPCPPNLHPLGHA